jgi:TonB family protein
MGYRALLFCPDEKTARTVTQVLSELEFSVETCAEPFAAVKKLMGEHFDALVVDCDNEQNATLLFKSARNSTSNQGSLAVAVVEGQAGVAKAFRIGANLVLTKPINVEQAKGTLRVARGLLRKGEPAKPAPAAGTASSPAAPEAKPAAAKPVPTTKPTSPSAPVVAAPPRPIAPPIAKPAAIPVAASSSPEAQDDDLLDINADDSAHATPVVPAAPDVAKPAPVASARKLPTPAASVPPSPVATAPNVSAFKAASTPTLGSGAASAPAPAREAQEAHTAEAKPAHTEAEELFEKPADAVSDSPLPSFTFGGAVGSEESSGNSKKILLAVAAVVIIGVAGYVAWGHFKGNASQPATTASQPAATPAPKPASVPSNPAPAAAAPASTPASSSQPTQPAANVASTAAKDDAEGNDSGDNAPAASPSSSKAANSRSDASKPTSSGKPAAAPLVVKSGGAPAKKTTPAAPDAPPPSVIGMAVPGSSAPPNLISGTASVPKPILQTVNVSQGVSQGLLVKKVQPTYPSNALTLHVEGAVELLATISKNGNITAVKVVSGPPLLTRAASDAVKQWKYKPYLLNGEPVEIQTQVTINFRLPH